MKKLLMTLVVAAPIALGFGLGGATTADAKTSVNIYMGVPYYSYQVGPDYQFRKGHGWYRPGRPNHRKMSCNQARDLVRDRGYRNVQARNCGGQTYVFRATRNGRAVIVYVNSRTGAVWRA